MALNQSGAQNLEMKRITELAKWTDNIDQFANILVHNFPEMANNLAFAIECTIQDKDVTERGVE